MLEVTSVEMAALHHYGEQGLLILEGSTRRDVVVAAGLGKVLVVSLLSDICVC